MNAVLTVAQPAIPWYKSQVMIGSVVTIVSTASVMAPKLAVALGLTNPDAVSTGVNALFTLIALGSGIWTAIARKASTVQPVTLTQAAADAHPATLIATRTAVVAPTPAPSTKPPWSL